jgi:hypothetical protein
MKACEAQCLIAGDSDIDLESFESEMRSDENGLQTNRIRVQERGENFGGQRYSGTDTKFKHVRPVHRLLQDGCKYCISKDNSQDAVDGR